MNKFKNHFLVFGLFLIVITFGFSIAFIANSKIAPAQSSQAISQISGTKTEEVQNQQNQLPKNPDGQSEPINVQSVKVIRVIDGDTIEIEGGQKVRYIGIDTPETVDPRKQVQCFGAEAAAKNRELVEGKNVYLAKDVSETDKYGRLLRYVILPAGKAGVGDLFVNDFLVREGYAYASSYPPDVLYQDQLNAAQGEAQANSRGLWLNCSGGKSSVSSSAGNQPPQDGCMIKGNISSSGEKIYHILGQKYYDKTVIDQSRGERWFCTEEEAANAGWRKSKL